MAEQTRPVRRRPMSQREYRKRRRQIILKYVLKWTLELALAAFIIFLGVKLLRGKPEPEITVPSGGWHGYREAKGEPASALVLDPVAQVGSALERTGAFLLYPEGRRVPETSVTLLAVGDNLMHSTVLMAGEQGDGSYDFHNLYKYIQDEVQSVDLACINQETIFINDPKEYTNYPIFGGPTAVGEALADTGFDVVTHATNHCYDKYFTGISDTLRFWRKYPEITTLGIHDSQEDADRIRVVEKNGVRIALLNYTYGTNMGNPSEAYMIDFLEEDKVASDLAKARELADVVLVFPHWGTEGQYVPDDYQKKWGAFLAEHGADAVIGGHPHTLQPLEEITTEDGRHVPVFWSLGNFISHMRGVDNQLGGMARLTICRDRFGFYLTDVELVPTMTYGTEDFGQWQFYGMRLEDYTDEMAPHHWVEGTSVEQMWDLYRRIIPEQTASGS